MATERCRVVDPGTIRAAWALLANSFARGFSGASPELVEALVDRVNANAVPTTSSTETPWAMRT